MKVWGVECLNVGRGQELDGGRDDAVIDATIEFPHAGGPTWGERGDLRTLVPPGEIPSKLHSD